MRIKDWKLCFFFGSFTGHKLFNKLNLTRTTMRKGPYSLWVGGGGAVRFTSILLLGNEVINLNEETGEIKNFLSMFFTLQFVRTALILMVSLSPVFQSWGHQFLKFLKPHSFSNRAICPLFLLSITTVTRLLSPKVMYHHHFLVSARVPGT